MHWVLISCSRGSFLSRDYIPLCHVFSIGRQLVYHWVTSLVLYILYHLNMYKYAQSVYNIPLVSPQLWDSSVSSTKYDEFWGHGGKICFLWELTWVCIKWMFSNCVWNYTTLKLIWITCDHALLQSSIPLVFHSFKIIFAKIRNSVRMDMTLV